MAVVKTKAGLTQGPRKRVIQRFKLKKTVHGKKIFGAKVEKLTDELGRDLKGQIMKIAPETGRHVMDFSVIVDHGEVLFEKPRVTGKIVKATVEKPKAAFDPYDAGRKAVAQMQDAEGGAWTGAELEENYGLSPANLHRRRAEHRIVWWRDAKNQFHYPKWQFNHAGALLPGVQEVLQTFRSPDEWRVMRYFLAPRHQLDDRMPLDLLRAGKVDKVIAHAKAHGEENSW